MAARLGGDADEPIAEINIVPFVDIILVILIIFMVTTPLIMKPSINVNLPKAASGDETTPSSKLGITITKTGQVLLNGEESSEEAIKAYATDMSAKKPDVQAIISADKDVPHGQVVGVIDAVKSGGVKKFAITIDNK
jgi:biopolymer transport protein ExbD